MRKNEYVNYVTGKHIMFMKNDYCKKSNNVIKCLIHRVDECALSADRTGSCRLDESIVVAVHSSHPAVTFMRRIVFTPHFVALECTM